MGKNLHNRPVEARELAPGQSVQRFMAGSTLARWIASAAVRPEAGEPRRAAATLARLVFLNASILSLRRDLTFAVRTLAKTPGLALAIIRRSTKEIGIRMALGAPTENVLWGVVRRGMILTGIGLAVGLAISAAVGRLYNAYLYGVSGTYLITFVSVPLLLAAVAFIATFVPASRAARVSPCVALRHE